MEKLTKVEVFSLTNDAYFKKSSDEKYTAQEREEGLRTYLADLNKDFRNNKNEIYAIIEESVNKILPKKVADSIKSFAEFREFANGDTVKFKIKSGKIKAVSLAVGAVAERHRLDNGFAFMKVENIQCKVYDEYERFLAGQIDWTDMINQVTIAINDVIMEKIYTALTGIYANLPDANKHTSNAFDKVEFDKLIAVSKAYGTPVIMGTPLAVAQIPLDTFASEADKLDIRTKGRLGIYKGCNVVELQQSYTDESNETPVFDDQYLFVIPAGQEKIVKVAFEGGLVTRDENGKDWTLNFEAYQKAGVGIMYVNNICIYKNTSL